MPRVSIVMPLYNAEKYIINTLNSLLEQTYRDFEIVIVDDGSKDNSVIKIEELSDERIKLYKNEENKGIAFTRNRAIELCSGEYVALMDDDDIAPKERIEKEVLFLDTHKEIDVVGGHCRFIDENNNVIKNKQWNVFQNPKYIKAYLLTGDAIPNGSAMFRRDFIEKHKIKYKDNMCGAEDYQFWVECSLKGSIANIDEILLYWRIGHNNETTRRSNIGNEREEAINSIREFAFAQNGFNLTATQYTIINKAFKEESNIETMDEIFQLFSVLKEIVKQADTLKLDFANEIKTLCRKRFGEKIGKAFFLWE